MKIDVEEWAKANHRSGWRKDPFEMLRDLGKHVKKMHFESLELTLREYELQPAQMGIVVVVKCAIEGLEIK